MRAAVLEGLRHDVSQDIPFWHSKRNTERPLLAEGDGPIAIYRRWCKQFYPAASQAAWQRIPLQSGEEESSRTTPRRDVSARQPSA